MNKNNIEMKWVHGPKDKKTGPPSYLGEAYGVVLDPPLSQVEAGELFRDIGQAVTTFLELTDKANNEIRKATSNLTGNKKILTEAFMEDSFKQHQARINRTITVHSDLFISDEPKAQVVVEDLSDEVTEAPTPSIQSTETSRQVHQRLRAEIEDQNIKTLERKYAITRDMLQLCSDIVVDELEKVHRRDAIILTKDKLITQIDSRYGESLPSDWEDRLLLTLCQDGWVLFEHDGKSVCAIPYGVGLPAFKEGTEDAEHPIWDTL